MLKLNANYTGGVLTLEYCGPEESGFVIKYGFGNCWRLYEIPQYGGATRLYGVYNTFGEAIEEARSWT